MEDITLLLKSMYTANVSSNVFDLIYQMKDFTLKAVSHYDVWDKNKCNTHKKPLKKYRIVCVLTVFKLWVAYWQRMTSVRAVYGLKS